MRQAIRNLVRMTGLVAAVTILGGADWRQFRGTDTKATGDIADLAKAIDASKPPAWKASLPGRGLSSAIVVGDRVFLTASSGPEQDRLHVLCFDAATGAKKWERQFWATGRTMTHSKTCVAAPTPASDGQRLFCLYSSNDLACLDLDGNLLWYRALGIEHPNASNSLGMAASPIVLDNTLVVPSENDSESFVAGVDVYTGENRWFLNRPKKANWTTPVILETEKGKDVVLQSSAGLVGVNPAQGTEEWTFSQGCSTMPSAVPLSGTLIVPCNGLTALKLDPAKKEPSVVWSSSRSAPSTASPIAVNNRVYSLNSSGVVKAINTSDGEIAWQLRLRGPFSSSPVASGGRLFFVSETGLIQVVEDAKTEGKIVAQHDLGQTVLATPSIGAGGLFVRSDQTLWKFTP